MKKLSIAMALVIAASTFVYCKKDPVTTTAGIEGMYVGKWGDVTGDPHTFYKIELKKGGSLKRFDETGAVTANGTWKLTGIEMEASYTHSNGEMHSIGGLYTGFNGEINGTWGYGNSKAGGGTFLLKKKVRVQNCNESCRKENR